MELKKQHLHSFQVNDGTLTKTDHIVGHKASLKFQFCKMCSLIRTELNMTIEKQKILDVCKVSNIFLNTVGQ